MVAPKRSKYFNRKVVKNGETFDSVREYERHLVLLDMQTRGEIKNLERQPRFQMKIDGKVICTYVPDWKYLVVRDEPVKIAPGMTRFADVVCEDAKGYQTAEFKLKFRLAKALYPEIDWRLS